MSRYSGKFDGACLVFNSIIREAGRLQAICVEYLQMYQDRTDEAALAACEEIRRIESFLRCLIGRLADKLATEQQLQALARLPGRIADYLRRGDASWLERDSPDD
jgi:hypothetical protein